MNILVFGAHCDDPESGCGGLAVLAVQRGHRVGFVYFSSGIPGNRIKGQPEGEVREAESREACNVCGTEPIFLRFPCSNIPFHKESVQKVSDLAREWDADLILTHWPVDTHPDHQAVGALGTQVVVGNPRVGLAYYETAPSVQTLAFEPNRFVDITQIAEQKYLSVRRHASQTPDVWWPIHADMERVRYRQCKGFSEIDGRAEGYYLAVSTPLVENLLTSRAWLQPSGSRSVRKTKHEDIPL